MEYTSYIYILKETKLLRTSAFQNLKFPFCSNNFEGFFYKNQEFFLLLFHVLSKSMNACFNECGEGMYQEKKLSQEDLANTSSCLQAAI